MNLLCSSLLVLRPQDRFPPIVAKPERLLGPDDLLLHRALVGPGASDAAVEVWRSHPRVCVDGFVHGLLPQLHTQGVQLHGVRGALFCCNNNNNNNKPYG